MDKTRSIDFTTLTLMDALDLATLIEEEAQERYGELADQMEIHHNPEAARFFRFMFNVEGKHEDKLSDRREALFGLTPRTVRREMLFDIEAPEYHEVRAGMSVRDALLVSLRAEQKAYEFFDSALLVVRDDKVVQIFRELREEEAEHQHLIEKELAKLPPDEPLKIDDVSDDPVAQ